jgi:hypothetical protein
MGNQRSEFKDFIRRNSMEAIGPKSAISAAMKQNFKPVLEMNPTAIERDKNCKRKDLYQIYTHFLSIYRMQ